MKYIRNSEHISQRRGEANFYDGEKADRLLYKFYDSHRRKLRLIEGNAKCHHLKTLTCKGTSRKVFICLRPINLLPLPYTLYTCIQYTYSHREGGGVGGIDPNRRLGGQQFTTLGQICQHD
jgi:hypothetical protein